MVSVNWTDVTTPTDFLQVANTTTGDLFWAAMLAMLSIILMISLLPFGFEAAVLAAAFSGFMLGMILAYLHLVSWTWVVMYAGIIVAMGLWIMYSQKNTL